MPDGISFKRELMPYTPSIRDRIREFAYAKFPSRYRCKQRHKEKK